MQIMTTEQLIKHCKSSAWYRDIKQLHIHHTWEPDHSDYNGKNGMELQQAMKNYHVKSNGWSDIGQHLTLLPDGLWVTGRDFNKDPASISGWNEGAFAIEMIGNFDTGHDKFTGKQAQEMFKFCAFFVQFKGLSVDNDIKFHRDNPTAGKTCPGSGIDRVVFMESLKNTIKGNNNVPEWKVKALKELYNAGLVSDLEGWTKKLDEPLPAWAAFIVMNNIYNKVKGDK